MVNMTILCGETGPGEVRRQRKESGGHGVAWYPRSSQVTHEIDHERLIPLCLRYRWSFIGCADGESTQRTLVDSGKIPPSAAGRRRCSAPRVGGAVHRRGREWSAARFYFGEAPHRG